MRHSSKPILGPIVDRRTALDRAKDELTDSLRERGDATTVAAVIRFIDEMRNITDRVLFRDYSAERFAFGRVATVGCGRDAGWLADCRSACSAASSGSDIGG